MSKITNKKECYQSRSKNVSKKSQEFKQNLNIRQSREEFKINRNGYFVWDFDSKSKKM
jgi:hypothetical protein